MTEKVVIYTDGACSGNPGMGGWGAILMYGERRREISGYKELTTNNQMELTAAIEALRMLKRPCDVELYTDSQYVKNGITNWIDGWKLKGWRNSQRQEVKNKELWQELDELRSGHNVRWFWVRGHAENQWNERADVLARAEIDRRR